MDDLWFRRIDPDDKLRYHIVHAKGLAATLVFVVASLLSVTVPPLAGGGSTPSLILAGLLFCASLAGFFHVLRRHSDWHG